MTKHMNIYLIGFMATGKSTAGKRLAAELSLRFVDLDSYIEEKSGARIADIFARAGESFFRTLERKFLAEVSRQDGQVVACGGGIVIDPENVRVMKATGDVVCLSASAKTIVERSKGSDRRPLLETPGERTATVEQLLSRRASLYAVAADTCIDTDTLSPEEVARRIIVFLGRGSA